MIPRAIEKELALCMAESPAILVTGPRQSGKTTLACKVARDVPYFSFENPLLRTQFLEDPVAFLKRCESGAVLDEAQHVPELFSYLQGEIDRDPAPGRYIITGSQQLGLVQSVTQSLAGRVSLLELLPFSIDELSIGGWLDEELDVNLWKGAYPPVFDRRYRPARWFADYIKTYIERDVRQVTQVQNLDQFTRFVQLCAGNVGSLFNASRLGADCGIDQKTARKWLSILQTAYIARTLSPYYNNFRKRTIKTPKLYFHDTGLVCALLGISDPAQLSSHPLRGAVFENWVFSELSKSIRNTGSQARLYFWRTHGGQEVDFILEEGTRVVGVEAKSGMSIMPGMLHSMNNAMESWPADRVSKVVLYGGDESLTLSGCRVEPWRNIGDVLARL